MKYFGRDAAPHYARIALQRVGQHLFTFLGYFKAAWWNISIERGCTFVGPIKFRRTPGSVVRIGRKCRFLSSFSSNLHGLNRPCMISTLRPQAAIHIGDNVGISGTVIACAIGITIGDGVMIGANTTISDTDSHPIDHELRRGATSPIEEEAAVKNAPVRIGAGVFIGMHSLVLKGVTIGEGCVVGAGSVVSRDLPPYSIAAGNPARVIRQLSDRPV